MDQLKEKSTSIAVEKQKQAKAFSPISRQLFATSGSILLTVSAGMIVGYSAILLPKLRENQDFSFSPDEESWIASMAALPMAPGCLLGGVIMEIYGRKWVNILVSIPFFIGWFLIYFTSGLTMFLLGRLLQGISLGICGPLNSVFIGETTDPKYRGAFLGSVSLGYALGICISHLLGTFLHWKTTAAICSLINVISFLIFFFVPESPSYLISKGKFDAARDSFTWLRGYGSEANEEFELMILRQKDMINGKPKITLNYIRQREFYKPLLVLLGLFFILQFVGVNAVTFYTINIMNDTIGMSFNQYYAMIFIDVIRFVIGIVACGLIKKIKRRPLFIVTGLGTGICMFLLSVFLYLSKNNNTLNEYSYVAPILLIGYICFTGLGLMPLPWCLIGELFPLRSRGLGSGIASASNFVFFFIVVKTAPLMFTVIGTDGTFLFYGLVGILGTVLLGFFMPETMNKTLQEIEDEFSSKNIQQDGDHIEQNSDKYIN